MYFFITPDIDFGSHNLVLIPHLESQADIPKTLFEKSWRSTIEHVNALNIGCPAR